MGGGATGCGAALDACTRGLSTALIERSDFASETSARSTKLIWAGIRYIGTSLAQLLRFRNFTRPLAAIDDFIGEFNMVLGCHKERKLIMENNPHLTNWVPIAVPMRTWISWPPPLGHPLFALAPFTMPAVLKFYDSLSGFSCPPSHVMGKARARRKFPQLDQDFKYVSVFYEGQHNDARTATCIALAAAEEGATITNHTEMVGIVREGDLNDESTTLKKGEGKAVGAIVRDKISGKEFVVRARSIIFAGGPFTDGMRKMEDPKSKAAVNGAAGKISHLLLISHLFVFCLLMFLFNLIFFIFLHSKSLQLFSTIPILSAHFLPQGHISFFLGITLRTVLDCLTLTRPMDASYSFCHGKGTHWWERLTVRVSSELANS